MPLEVKRRKGENVGSLLFRFSKRVKQSGVLREVKKRRFRKRTENRNKRRQAALYRRARVNEITELKKHGIGKSNKK